jgi:hypothetical protein
VIRLIDMIFKTLIELRCILNRKRWEGYSSELEIQRELDLTGTGSGHRLPKSRHRRQA